MKLKLYHFKTSPLFEKGKGNQSSIEETMSGTVIEKSMDAAKVKIFNRLDSMGYDPVLCKVYIKIIDRDYHCINYQIKRISK
jgi:hypothetical protein